MSHHPASGERRATTPYYVVSRYSTTVEDGGRRANVANIFAANSVTASSP
jgi:hypothetical protein